MRKEEGEDKISEAEPVLSLVFKTLQLNCWKQSWVGGYTRSGLGKEKLVWVGSTPFIGNQAPECADGGVGCALGDFARPTAISPMLAANSPAAQRKQLVWKR